MSEVKETSGGSVSGESLRASPKVLTAGDRKLLKVELRPGDTTYVSWKKLMRDASKVNGSSASDPDPPPNANPNLESPIAPGQPAEIETNDQPHSNRFNAVIEKIERLYKGNDSSDGEELDGAPDDDEYDTEDSFIDDAELDEYFEVDNSAVKHDGFYVNRGKLEQIEPSTISNQQPKKRRRRDSAKPFGDAVDVSDKHTKLSVTARRKGNDSSDGEELDGAPDDDEYDTEDSFIDDVELDEYFEVDNSAVKNDGFYGNRGKLEQIEPSTISNQQPKKRRRKDSAEPFGDAVDVSDKHPKLSITARRKDQSTASESSLKRKYNVARKTQESPLLFGAQDANTSLSLDEVKHSDRANHQNKKDTSHKSKETGSSSALHQKYNNKGLNQQSKFHPGKFPPNVSAEATIVRQKENNGMHELANAMGSRQSSQVSKKDGSIVKSKTLILEKAIRELEKVVTESRPSAITENQEADTSSQAVKRRLPRDVKLKLAKVARIAASQGKLSAELTNRLMSIVGHLIQLRSLKRNLKIMIDMGDSANREKDTRFQRINNEVLDMIKAKVSLMESQATKPEGGTSDDFQDSVEKPSLKKFVMDAALEDKLCDLYDIFIEGLDKDEDQGPQIRKLYVNLAKLWPNRLMDNHGIKRAICRAKERQKALYGNIGKETDQTKMKKSRKQLVPKTDWTAQPNTESVAQRQQSGEEMTVDPNATSTSVVTSQTMVDRSNQEHEKLKGSSSSCNPVEETRVVKRKTEAIMAEKQIVLALKKPEQHPQPRVIPAPQNLNIPQTTPDLNLPS